MRIEHAPAKFERLVAGSCKAGLTYGLSYGVYILLPLGMFLAKLSWHFVESPAPGREAANGKLST